MFNYKKYVEYAEKAGVTQVAIAESIGVSIVSLWRKKTGVSDFFLHEVELMRKILKLTDKQLIEVFFSDQTAA